MSERLQLAATQLDLTRQYTYLVLDHTDRARWYELPPGCPTHSVWQVGHIAFAQAIHIVRTVCGQPTTDPLPQAWVKIFGKDSAVSADPSVYPPVNDLLAGFDAVFERTKTLLATLPDPVFDEPASHNTGMVHNKLDLLYWVIRHEMLHTGQIGLLRRLLGELPYR